MCCFCRLPKAILIHFVEGLPRKTTWPHLDFTHAQRSFRVTAVIQHKTSPDHFVAWLRDPVCKSFSVLLFQGNPSCLFYIIPLGEQGVIFWPSATKSGRPYTVISVAVVVVVRWGPPPPPGGVSPEGGG